LEHLFYEERIFKGIYAVYNAGDEKIDEKDLWIELFWSEDALDTLKQVIDINKVKNSKIRPDSRSNLTKLLQDQLQVDKLDDKALHHMVEGLSKLLVEENAGICLAIDNVDEYFRVMNEIYEKQFDKEEARNRVAARLLGTIRVATAGLDQIFLLLACTEDVHKQITEARVDLTHGRRVEIQQRKLGKLTEEQSKELVHSYLNWWAQRIGVGPPTVKDEDCSVVLRTGKKSIYPFSTKAVEYFYKVTRSMAGDIVCLCGQCINDMRREKKVSVVRGAAIPFAIQEAHRTFPQLVLNLDILEKDRHLYMKDLTTKRLSIILREMKDLGPDTVRITSAIEKYAEELGVRKISLSSAHDYRDYARSVSLSQNSRVWEYKDRKILVKYVIGFCPPKGPVGKEFGYGAKIETSDKMEVLSYLEDDKVTHALFIGRWADTSWHTPWHMSKMSGFSPCIDEFNVDEAIRPIVGVIEDTKYTGRDRDDLISHVEKFHVRLLLKLDSLVEKTKHEESLGRRRKRDKEALTKGIA